MKRLRIGIVAGEVSGDYLGAGLMHELRRIHPNVHFSGIGGERMRAEGMDSIHPLESLSVMGLVEVLRHLPELLRIRRDLLRRFLTDPPDAFIGIDAPDFNLGLERRLKRHGIPTVHYVSPTVWAWRRGRVKTIRRAVDLMLSIFPFEAEFLDRHGIPVTFVGHPLADEIPLSPDRTAARRTLGITGDDSAGDDPVIALLPGSRMSEVTLLGPVFLQTADWLTRQRPGLRFVVPCSTERIQAALQAQVRQYTARLEITLHRGRSRDCLAAANAVLLASGTASLEALLHKRPMVVAYKVAPTTGWLAKRLIKVDFIAMPNLIAGRRLVEEFVQEQAVPENLGPAMLALLDRPEQRQDLQNAFIDLHRLLQRGADRKAAVAVADLLARRLSCGPRPDPVSDRLP